MTGYSPPGTHLPPVKEEEADGGGIDPYRGRVPGARAHRGLRGVSLLGFISRRTPGYLDNPVRQNLFRAGHAHAGVLIILALVGLLYVDQADLGDGLKQLVRWCLAAAPILMPLGFFLSVASPRAERPNRMILFTYVGGLLLAVGILTLGIGLLRARRPIPAEGVADPARVEAGTKLVRVRLPAL